MTSIDTKTLTDALHWRYATKKFDPARKIPQATWAALEEALVLSPSSYGLEPWKFFQVQDPAVREKISKAAYGQRQPVDCSHLVVFTCRKGLDNADIDQFLQRTAATRGAPLEALKGYGDIIRGSADRARAGGYLDVWSSRQVYIALGVFLTAAALLGVDACPMEGFDPAQVDEILDLKSKGYFSVALAAAGYRAADDKYAANAKVRLKPDQAIAHL